MNCSKKCFNSSIFDINYCSKVPDNDDGILVGDWILLSLIIVLTAGVILFILGFVYALLKCTWRSNKQHRRHRIIESDNRDLELQNHKLINKEYISSEELKESETSSKDKTGADDSNNKDTTEKTQPTSVPLVPPSVGTAGMIEDDFMYDQVLTTTKPQPKANSPPAPPVPPAPVVEYQNTSAATKPAAAGKTTADTLPVAVPLAPPPPEVYAVVDKSKKKAAKSASSPKPPNTPERKLEAEPPRSNIAAGQPTQLYDDVILPSSYATLQHNGLDKSPSKKPGAGGIHNTINNPAPVYSMINQQLIKASPPPGDFNYDVVNM